MFSHLKNLSVRLPALMLLLSLPPLVGFGLFVMQLTTQGLLTVQMRANQRAAMQAASQVDDRLAENLHDLTVSAENLGLSELPDDELEWALLALLKQQNELYALTLLGPQGDERMKVARDSVFTPSELRNRAAETEIKEALGGQTSIGEPTLVEGLGYKFCVAIPIIDPEQRTVAAVLEAELLASTILTNITEIRIGEKGFMFVVDQSNHIIAHRDPSLTRSMTAFSYLAPPQASTDSPVTGQIYRNLEGTEVIGASATLAQTPWQIIAERPLNETLAGVKTMQQTLFGVLGAILALILPLTLYLTRQITRPLQRLEEGAKAISRGQFDQEIPIQGTDELSRVTQAFNLMTNDLHQFSLEQKRTNWIKDGLSLLEGVIRGNTDLDTLSRRALQALARYGQISAARLLLRRDSGGWRQTAAVSLESADLSHNDNESGLALVQQAASTQQPVELCDVPESSLVITTGFGDITPRHIYALPLLFDEKVVAVLEMARFLPFSEDHRQLLGKAAIPLATAIHSSQAQQALQEAFEKAQHLTAELQAQQEELRVSNEELEEQTQQLRASEELLRNQQEELQAANEELEEKSESLVVQQSLLEEKNEALQSARTGLEEKAKELEKASRYKSEFLANMSHELRTPLNSLLILSQELATNKQRHLSAKEVEAAHIIHSSGRDLLQLINEILDLSKIEAGHLEMRNQPVFLDDLTGRLNSNFQHMAAEKMLDFTVSSDDGLPEQFSTDPQRLDQVLKNLLANAIKFTEKGSVRVHLYRPDQEEFQGKEVLAIAISDTGIGIPENRLEDIFGAFQQVDGSISRRFGGTGLGLSITRELCKLLGAEVRVRSELGAGSTFTLYLPLTPPGKPAAADIAPATTAKTAPRPSSADEQRAPDPAPALADDRGELKDTDKVILIVEDDLNFARILADLCHDHQFKYLHSGDGESALERIKEHPAIAAIILDMRLPGMHGLEFLEILKNDRNLRHIPVHVITASEDSDEALQRGALNLLHKPTSRSELDHVFVQIETMSHQKIRTLLIVEGEKNEQQSILQIIGNGDVKSITAGSGSEALQLLQQQSIDCMILDLNLPDMTGIELLQSLKRQEGLPIPPVIVYTAQQLSPDDEARLHHYTRAIILKNEERSPERLLDEASLFLHRMVAQLPDQKQKMIDSLHNNEMIFKNKTILLVDDDMRNVFALTHVLEQRGLNVVTAVNGKKALERLEQEKRVDLVLMDIMMPVMDGYETIERIRANTRWRNLPILALTAKAMPEDRKRCIEAGANDYLAKPVHMERLLSLLRVWLYR